MNLTCVLLPTTPVSERRGIRLILAHFSMEGIHDIDSLNAVKGFKKGFRVR